MKNRLAKLFKYALLVALPAVMLLASGITAFAQDWQTENNEAQVGTSFTIVENYSDSLPLSQAWLDPSWEQRIELTIDHTDVDADLVDFPVMIYLSAASGIGADDVTAVFDEVGANSHKIAVTTDDEVSECYVEVEDWDDIGEEAWLHVNVPNISSTIDTTLYLYYDNDHADNDTYVGDTNSTPAENVWDSNFVFVSHMADGVDNAHIYDSTSNDNDGTKKGANEPVEAAGLVGKAQSHDGSDDYIDYGNSASMAWTTQLTAEWYGDVKTLAVAKAIVGKYETDQREWVITNGFGAGTGTMAIQFGDPADGSFEGRIVTANILSADTRYLLSFTFNGGTVKTYVDGSEVANAIDTGAIPNSLYNGTATLRTGHYQTTYGQAEHDEIRISDIARSAAWIKATNESMVDDFITYGAEEVPEEVPTVPGVTTNDPDIDGTSATFHGEITDTGYPNADLDDYIGFVWDIATHANPGNVAPAISGYANNWTLLGAYGVEAFEYDITGLVELTTYYYRACAHNDAGWVYGDEITFFITEDGEVYLEFRPDLDETLIRANGGVPSDTTVGIYNGYSLPIWNAGANINEQLSYLMYVPDRWDGDTQILVQVITALSNAAESGNGYQLQIDWEHVTPNQEEVPVTTHTIVNSRTIYSDTQYECYKDWLIIDYDVDVGDNVIVGDELALRFRRIDVLAGQKELNGEVIILAVNILFARGDFLADPSGNVITIINNMITEGSLIGGEDMLFLSCIGFAGFMTWFAAKRRNLLLSILAGVCWFGLAMWLFFASTALMDLDESYAQILVWVFFTMTFVPLVLYMNVPITRTRSGQTWTEYGEPPDEHKSEYQKYAEDLHARMYRHRKKRRLL